MLIEVDFGARTVAYLGCNGEYPAVAIDSRDGHDGSVEGAEKRLKK